MAYVLTCLLTISLKRRNAVKSMPRAVQNKNENMVEADIRNAFNNIFLDHLSYNDNAVDYSCNKKRGSFPYEEKLQLDDMSVTVFDATPSIYCPINRLSYHDDVEKHNKDIAEAKKMQMKFNGM